MMKTLILALFLIFLDMTVAFLFAWALALGLHKEIAALAALMEEAWAMMSPEIRFAYYLPIAMAFFIGGAAVLFLESALGGAWRLITLAWKLFRRNTDA